MTKITDISRDSSSSFNEESSESRVKSFVKHMLKCSLFIGTFQEKRFVESLGSYRDVIKVSDDETDLIDNLIAVRKRLTSFYSKDIWIGITDPKTVGAPMGHNLWVDLDEEVFGSYWYKVKTVEFYNNEVRLRLEVVRPISREKTPFHNITPQRVFEDISRHDVSELTTTLNNYLKEKINQLFTKTLTYSNIKEVVIFIFLLTSTLITFFIHGIKYFLDYFLKLLHEISGLIKVCAPIIISFISFISKTVNGFFNLVAVLWRTRSQKFNQNLYPMLPFKDGIYFNTYKALPYPEQEHLPRNRYRKLYGSQVKITPLN